MSLHIPPTIYDGPGYYREHFDERLRGHIGEEGLLEAVVLFGLPATERNDITLVSPAVLRPDRQGRGHSSVARLCLTYADASSVTVMLGTYNSRKALWEPSEPELPQDPLVLSLLAAKSAYFRRRPGQETHPSAERFPLGRRLRIPVAV